MKNYDSKMQKQQNTKKNNRSHNNGHYGNDLPSYDDSQAQPRHFPEHECKAVWANYLNMARQNLFQTLCHINHVLGLKDSLSEDNLLITPAVKLLNKKSSGKAEQKQKAMELFDKHFPFLEPMLEKLIEIKNRDTKKGNDKKNEIKEKTPEMYYEIMEMILPLINLLRNKYTHYKLHDSRLDDAGNIADPQMLDRCDQLAQLLDYCITGARRTVKERFSVGKPSTHVLEEALKEVDKTLLKPADFNFLEGRLHYFDFKTETGKKVKRERSDFKYRTRHEDTKISNMGIFMLICLMISKKHASEFADKTDFFGTKQVKDPRLLEKEITIMREIISVYRIRLPKERLQSTRDTSALGLDMLNELKKCPHELFDTLDAAHQEQFRVETSDEDDSVEKENGKILLLRSHDRFATFALRYIDSLKLFDSIRFQVRLGNYRYKFYEKEWIDGHKDNDDERIRILQKELTGFGRIDEIEQARNDRWGNLIRRIDLPRQDSLDTKPYVTDHHASYLIHNNRIGLLWNTSDRQILKNGIFMPTLDLPEWLDGYPQNAGEIRGTEEKADRPIAQCHAPLCWLSIYELPALIFLSILTKSGKEAEKIIKKTVDNYHRFFNDLHTGQIIPYDPQTKQSFIPMEDKARIKADKTFRSNYVIEPYGIKITDLPDKLQDFLLNESLNDNNDSRFIKLAKSRLDDMIAKTQARCEIFRKNRELYGSKDNKIGKTSHIDIRPGTLARYLAKDIMLFKKADENNQVKLTGQNFNILQAELAQYRMSETELRRLLTKAELINCTDPHPFLEEVINRHPKTFFDFYQTYLEKKIAYLKSVSAHGKNALKELHFLHYNRKKWAQRDKKFYQELCGRYTSIELPKGLFLPAIIDAIKADQAADKAPLKDALAGYRINTTYLIAAYQEACGDGYQTFYGNKFKRYYKYISKLKSSAPNAPLEKQYLSVEEMEKFLLTAKKQEEKYLSAFNREKDKKISIAKSRKRNRDVAELNEEKEIEPRKLRKYRNEYSQNEKAIRRQKVQDVLLFHMAKSLLTNVMDNNGSNIDFSAYRLRDIGRNGNKDILSLQMPFSIVLQIPTQDGSVREIKIEQKSLKLKNYGDFFRFIYDSRVRPLLAQIKSDYVSRENLETEFDNYDQQRIPLFELVHDLEGKIWEQLPDEKLHPVDSDGKPLKVDFKYLLQFIDTEESNKDLLRVIRNAFSHNNYPTDAAVKVIFDRSDIPDIARTLAQTFERKAKQMGTDLKE